MKTIMKVFGIVCAAIGGAIALACAIVAFFEGPKKTWRLIRDSLKFGENYEF